MANTKQLTVLQGGASDPEVVVHLHLISDGSQETNYVVFDNSTLVNNVAKGRLMEVWFDGKISGVARLNWDQTTPFKAVSLKANTDNYVDFRCIGGIANPNGSGATGDLTLTTTGLASADEFFLIVRIRQ